MLVPSLKEYVLVSQAHPLIEVFRRPEERGHWTQEKAGAGTAVILHGEHIDVDRIYAE